MKAALCRTKAKRILVLNLQPQNGETSNFTPESYLESLAKANPDFRLNTVIADPRHVKNQKKLMAVATKLGAQVTLAEVGNTHAPMEQHNPDRLAYSFEQVF